MGMAAKKKKKTKAVKAKKTVKKASAAKKAKKAPAKKAAKKTKSVKTAKKKTPAKKTAKAVAKKKAPAKAVKKPAKKVAKKKKQVVGEGDYAASRAFLKDQSSFVEKNRDRIADLGQAAEKALEGPEGDDLRDAEAAAAGRSRDTF
jgi:hypothetical protein